jgi:hypothetical protein
LLHTNQDSQLLIARIEISALIAGGSVGRDPLLMLGEMALDGQKR